MYKDNNRQVSTVLTIEEMDKMIAHIKSYYNNRDLSLADAYRVSVQWVLSSTEIFNSFLLASGMEEGRRKFFRADFYEHTIRILDDCRQECEY